MAVVTQKNKCIHLSEIVKRSLAGLPVNVPESKCFDVDRNGINDEDLLNSDVVDEFSDKLEVQDYFQRKLIEQHKKFDQAQANLKKINDKRIKDDADKREALQREIYADLVKNYNDKKGGIKDASQSV